MPAGKKRDIRSWLRMDRERFMSLAAFLVKFNLLAIPMYFVIWSGVQFIPLQLLVRDLSFQALKAAGYAVSAPYVGLPYFLIEAKTSIMRIDIDLDCTGWKSMYALAALMIATPFPNDERKLSEIGLAVGAMFILNVARIVTTVELAVAWGIGSLDLIHTVLWSEGMIAAVLGIWAAWIILRKREPGSRASG